MKDGRRAGITEWETASRLLIAILVLGFLLALVGTIGEVLGWWNDVGEVLITVGTTTGTVTGALLVVERSSRHQARAVHAAVRSNRQQLVKLDRLEPIGRPLDTLDEVQLELDRQTGVLDRQLAVLTDVPHRV